MFFQRRPFKTGFTVPSVWWMAISPLERIGLSCLMRISNVSTLCDTAFHLFQQMAMSMLNLDTLESLPPELVSGICILWDCTTSSSSKASLKVTLMVARSDFVGQWHLAVIIELQELQWKSNSDKDYSTRDVAYEGGDFKEVAKRKGCHFDSPTNTLWNVKL